MSNMSNGIDLVGNDPTLFKPAQLALHSAKRAARDNGYLYAADRGADVARRLTLERELRGAIARDELLLHYQPQVDLVSRDIVGVEALVRWAHPKRGLMAPAQFVPLAEEAGLMVALGHWVLEAACRQMMRWRAAGHMDLTLAVNFSPHEFDQPDWPDHVFVILAATGLPPGNLELEITERALMHDPGRARSMLEQARASGIRITLDNFGTGYSSLAYLKTLSVDRLKIDRSFLRGCPHDRSDVAIIETLLVLSDRLGMAVIAEGVETPEQLAFLHERHCPQAQGYLSCAPVTAESVDLLLRTQCLVPSTAH